MARSSTKNRIEPVKHSLKKYLAATEKTSGIVYSDGMDFPMRYADLFEIGNQLAGVEQHSIRIGLFPLVPSLLRK